MNPCAPLQGDSLWKCSVKNLHNHFIAFMVLHTDSHHNCCTKFVFKRLVIQRSF